MVIIKIGAPYLKAIPRGFINFFKDNCVMHAGSLTFFSIVAVIPFCLLLLTLFNYVLGTNEEFMRFFVVTLQKLFPAITVEFTEKIIKLLSIKGIEEITLLLYAFQSFQLYLCLEFASNAIFKRRGRRHFLISFFLSLILVTLIIILILLSFGASSAITMLSQYREIPTFMHIDKITGFLLAVVVPLVLVFVAVASLYVIVPRYRIKLKYALVGALFTTVFLELAKYIFTFVMKEVIDFGVIYGSLSVTVVFLLWIFYSWCIFLIGAEIVEELEEGR